MNEYAQNCEYMGPVRKIDIMGALEDLIVVFEKVEKNNFLELWVEGKYYF